MGLWIGGTSGVTVVFAQSVDAPEDVVVFSPKGIAYRILTNEEGPRAKIARPRYLGGAGWLATVRGPSRLAIEASNRIRTQPAAHFLTIEG